MPFEPFNDGEDRPTRFVVHASGSADPARVDAPDVPQCKYAYEVTLSSPRDKPSQVLRETLKYWPPYAGKQVRLFERTEDGDVTAGKAFDLGGYRQALHKVLRPNVSVISTLAQLRHLFATVIRHTAASVVSNIFIEKQDVNDQTIARL
jgi:hypothetical protein